MLSIEYHHGRLSGVCSIMEQKEKSRQCPLKGKLGKQWGSMTNFVIKVKLRRKNDLKILHRAQFDFAERFKKLI